MVLILVILTIAAFLLVDLAIARGRKKAAAARAAETAPSLHGPACRLPLGFHLHGGHTWAQIHAAGDARVGIDEFARNVIGRIDRIVLPPPGVELRQGEKAFTVVQNAKRIDFVSPIDGVVSGANESLEASGPASGLDPYRDGWLLSVRPSNVARNLRKLRAADDAAAWLEKETRRFADFLVLHLAAPRELGVTMRDGGQPAAGAVETIDGELLQALVRKFFR